MQAQPLLTQSQFLMGIGEANQFADAFEECRLPQERAKVALQLKHLVTPAGMGESFHVLMASKGVDSERWRIERDVVRQEQALVMSGNSPVNKNLSYHKHGAWRRGGTSMKETVG